MSDLTPPNPSMSHLTSSPLVLHPAQTRTISTPDNMLLGSPQTMYHSPLPRRSSEIPSIPGHPDDTGDEAALRKRQKRASLPIPSPGTTSGSSKGRSSTLSAAGLWVDYDEDDVEAKKASKRATFQGAPTLTSCEACRKGKRRCEPSPLVPSNHPDVAKLPCSRCRRFALECVRVRVTRRKGPAPVDLSAISDAVHGFPHSNGQPSVESIPSTAEMYANQEQHGSFQSRSAGFASPAFPILAGSPSSITTAMPENLDQVVAGPVIDNIISLFFDYVYPLTPCLHRPTFIANLTARRDKADPVFFALTLTVIASTLVQVPRSLVNLDKVEVESLARRCVRVARAKTAFIYDDPGPVVSSYVVIAYLEGIVHLLLGNNTAHVICTATANQLALALRLNEESSYENLDPIECEIRRRIYWLLFQADKSTACLRARTICLRLEDAAALRLPSEVDDEHITANGIMPQPIGKTPLISGFNIATDLFRILNDALLLQRRKAPPTVDSILADLQNVNELRDKVMQTALEVATPLQMRKAYDSRISSPAQDWEAKLQERFLEFFQCPGDASLTLNSFMVMQGNILVTQHLVRLVLLQTRESLFQQLVLLTRMPAQGMSVMSGPQTSEHAEDIACELLDGLNSLPVECVATNGPSLVQKVRFVAIQLMECSVSPSPTTARAQKLLMQFLSVLSVIETLYTFGREISAE